MTINAIREHDLERLWREHGGEILQARAQPGYNGKKKGPRAMAREFDHLGLTESQMDRLLRYGAAASDALSTPSVRASAAAPPPLAQDLVEEWAEFTEEDLDDMMTDDEDLAELIERRTSAFERKRKKKGGDRVHTIKRKGPFAICHFGDPHLDADGCDWLELRRALKVVKQTPHMYGGNVGDTVNNWVGRLAALYKNQSSTETEAFALAHWFAHAIDWDYWVLGNHDHWQQGGLLFRYLTKGAKIRVIEDHEARIEYAEHARMVVRHDFKGHSMWNKSHSGMKRAKMRPWGHLYVAGHRHTWATSVEESAAIEAPCMSLRVRGFKFFDEYAEAHDFTEDQMGAHLTTVHWPDAPHPGERLKVFHDVEIAADYLGWLRSR